MIAKKIFFIYMFICILLTSSFSLSEEYGIRFNKGDTIYKISREHDIPPEIILKINGIKDPTKIKPGTKIKLPLSYIIASGDTLTGICAKYKISSDSVLKFNSIQDKEKLDVGKRLYLIVDESFHNQVTIDHDSSDTLSWPLPGKREKLSGKLSGAAIFGKAGDTIRSVSYGRVIWAGPYRGYGKMIFVKSDRDYVYIYAGNDQILVKVGALIKKDDAIGTLGASSHDGESKALFCIYKGKKALDPFTAARE
jgi:murein DD-endopeptidase MepM/ murein hydrolase activator NlpD